jgi:hypothetical protein
VGIDPRRATERADIERAILDEESMVDQVARLLERESDLAVWPEDARMALDDGAMGRTESWKALTLHRHLFGPTGVLAPQIPHRASHPGSTACVRSVSGQAFRQRPVPSRHLLAASLKLTESLRSATSRRSGWTTQSARQTLR